MELETARAALIEQGQKLQDEQTKVKRLEECANFLRNGANEVRELLETERIKGVGEQEEHERQRAALISSLNEKNAEVEQLKKELDARQPPRNVEELSSALLYQQDKTASLEKENLKLVASNNYLIIHFSEMKETIESNASEIQTLRKARDDKEAELTVLHSKLDGQKETATRRANEIAELMMELRSQDTIQLRQRKCINDLNNDIAELNASVESHKSQISALETEKASLQKDLRHSNTRCSSFRVEVEARKTDAETMKGKMTRQREEIDAQAQKMEKLEQHLMKVRLENSMLLLEKKSLESQVADRDAHCNEKTKELKTVRFVLSADIDNLSSQVQNLQKELEKAKQKNITLASDNRSLENRVADQDEKIASWKARRDRKKSELNTVRSTLSAEIDETQNKVQDLQKELKKAKQENATLLSQNKSLKTQLAGQNDTIELWSKEQKNKNANIFRDASGWTNQQERPRSNYGTSTGIYISSQN
ncbi:hypothetical protein GYMLUDRAFT_427526 [Collybiopsis luxurians FD-317 M1]|uniref:Uncharacterized protein n=1 Tax=Collybiopsis luxurians FD-317 M1 TaxID=944289 RepID=A0A0D0C7A3_9AGAR|nr:hypothetical protein GYMLUDRAFT_427526 [Collybiopsis luxurians FD-317 M1]